MRIQRGQVPDLSGTETAWNESHHGLAPSLVFMSDVSLDKKQILSEDWGDGPTVRELAAQV